MELICSHLSPFTTAQANSFYQDSPLRFKRILSTPKGISLSLSSCKSSELEPSSSWLVSESHTLCELRCWHKRTSIPFWSTSYPEAGAPESLCPWGVLHPSPSCSAKGGENSPSYSPPNPACTSLEAHSKHTLTDKDFLKDFSHSLKNVFQKGDPEHCLGWATAFPGVCRKSINRYLISTY